MGVWSLVKQERDGEVRARAEGRRRRRSVGKVSVDGISTVPQERLVVVGDPGSECTTVE